MTINHTWPGRAHLIVNGAEATFYFTLWLLGRRLHIGRRSALDVDGHGWMAGAPGPRPKKARKERERP